MFKLSRHIGLWSTLACAVALMPAKAAATVDFGKEGEPVKLVVGYQPYYTESWSGVVINGKQLWKKYLPAGSTVEFQIGLQGAITGGQALDGIVSNERAFARSIPSGEKVCHGKPATRLCHVVGAGPRRCRPVCR